MKKKVFAFDLGKTSIGFCVREGHDIKEADSIIIDKDHSDISAIRDLRRIKKTLKAHKSREEYFNNLWKDCGLEALPKTDIRFTKEFPSIGENIIYTSCLLRIALLQNRPLEIWQIYKALHNAIQRRGYDSNLPWKSAQTDDDKKNEEYVKKYTQENGIELIKNEKYKYPCYYDAVRLGLWEEDKPVELKNKIPFANYNKVRTTSYVAPRQMVIKELSELWENAQKQIPELNKFSVEEFLYGEYKQAYGSYVDPKFRQYLGTKNDWQGVLGQKIPRFNNRIIAKCKLLPKRNVCKADTIENVSLVLLMKLKNLRLTDISGEKVRLSVIDINKIYENWLQKIKDNNYKLDRTITLKEISKVTGRKFADKLEPLKANLSGRSSFCRRACDIMKKVILSGELYPQNMDVTEFTDPEGTKNGITEDEIRTMLDKIGDWNNLYIPDNRDENAQNADTPRIKTDIMIGNITNAVVRNRLQIFRDLLVNLAEKYGKPDEVIFEFVRDGADNSLFGQEKTNSFLKIQNANEKENKEIRQELEENDAYSLSNFEKLKLLRKQGGQCIYSGEPISVTNLDSCEIDHIYPRTMGGNDALYNKVLCLRKENQAKAGRTPYQWLSDDEERWAVFVDRVTCLKSSLGKKKFELLTSKPEDCEKLIESYNGLAETAHIARVAQQITALIFGWGLQVKDENRHIFVNNGSSTAAIRRRYGLNSLLGNDFKKNRDNDKHHALDAICISYSRDFKYDPKSQKDIIEGFNPETVAKVIDNIMPYPYTNKKLFKGNTRPQETIYGMRTIGDKSYITNRVGITDIKQSSTAIKNIIDEAIKQDLLNKLEEKMSAKEWVEMLSDYTHPTKKTKVKKVMVAVSEGTVEKDSNGRRRIGRYVDFGTKGVLNQFKRSKGHRGQILYYDEKHKIKLFTLYSNKSQKEAFSELLKKDYELYNKGEIYSGGCLIFIPENFSTGTKEYSSGKYKLNNIRSDGRVEMEDSNGIKIQTTMSNLAKHNFNRYVDFY